MRLARGGALAAAMDIRAGNVLKTVRGAQSVSGDMIVRAMRASGLSLAELLGGPAPVDRCRVCGRFKPRAG